MGSNDDGMTIGVDTDLDAVVGFARVKNVDVILEHRLDQFRDACAPRGFGDEIGFVLNRRQGIGDRNGVSACLQEGMVVFGIADRNDIVRGEAQVLERRF
jgi:hypothetical protein